MCFSSACGLLTISQMANFLYLDTPVGSGFSYARDPKGYDVGDYSSSLQVVTFLKKVIAKVYLVF